ncbi:MAG TPA: 5-formyltetrahydrofolate cyclo-ligase [Methylomirabilota bacterium]
MKRAAATAPAKQKIRERIWTRLRTRGAARFPFPLEDRIPNFRGAEAAAARLAELPEWQRARRLKCNPDAPQRAVRLRALEDGKEVFMAVPRLRNARCFLRLDPRRLRGRLSRAATIGGASALGEAVTPGELGHIDLVVAGSVAVNASGARVGKGGGYSDLEWALARALGIVDDETPVVTTVHDLQVVAGAIPMTDHDVPLDVVVTPTRVLRARRRRPKPRGIRWEELSDAQVAAMPVLDALRSAPRAGARSAPPPAPTSAPSPRRSR